MTMRWVDDKENRAEVADEMGKTLGFVQQWHVEGPKRAQPSKTHYRRHTDVAAGESDNNDSN
ncbi:hypothetical protein E2562_036733 [Oryza meyeriana var. granulata]|uniref:Uncharacterized protein n=1 Tax=Oryza meyeriana var. granulata TaxID=110450 RepID=A0A6G1E7H3_9ORYZ|nr:hypothetical protein E2562_036733 [Oryza meyeriana var. granulata]